MTIDDLRLTVSDRRPSVVGTLVLALLCALTSAGNGGLHAAEPQPVPPPPQLARAPLLPKCALAALSCRSLGRSLDCLQAYCNQAVPNGGAPAWLVVTSWLFPVPLGRGLALDGPASLFYLDEASGAPGQTVLVLPLANAAEFEASLRASFECTAQDGVLALTIPQPYGVADHKLLVRFRKGHVLLAPTAQVLRELELVTGDQGAAAFLEDEAVEPGASTKAPPPDLTLSLNVGTPRDRGLHETEVGAWIKAGLDALVQVLPPLARRRPALERQLLVWLHDVERLELHVALGDEATTRTLRLRPLPGSPLAQALSTQQDIPRGNFARPWLPEKPAFLLAGVAPASLAPPELNGLLLLQALLPDNQPGQEGNLDYLVSAARLVLSLDGETAVAVEVAPPTGLQFTALLGSSSPAPAQEALRQCLKLCTPPLLARLHDVLGLASGSGKGRRSAKGM